VSHVDVETNQEDHSIRQLERKKTVLHLSNVFDGGISRAISKIVELTPEVDHHLAASGGEIDEYAHLFSSVSRLPVGHIASIRSLQHRVALLQPDVVHAHSSWAGLYSRARPLPSAVVYQPHCFVTDDENRHMLERLAYRTAENLLSLRRQAMVTLSSHERATTMQLAGYRMGRIRVVALPNAATIQPRGDEAAHYSSGENATVAMIGRVCRQKDPDYFIAVVARLRQSGFRGQAIWIGDGDADTKARLVASGVVVTGWLTGPDLRSILQTVTVYVHTARYEGFPLSVLDAAAFGIPVLARRIACFADTPITTYSNVADLACGVNAALVSEARWSQEQLNSTALVHTMNEESQRTALSELYGFRESTVRTR
jgi:glycosyltransferase involved in cell wall biosynthesis